MPAPSLADIFANAVRLPRPDLPMEQGRAAQPDDVRALGELAATSDPPQQSRLFDSEIALVSHDEGAINRLEEERDSPALFPVLITQVGGSQGTSTTAATFTYTVRNLQGDVMGGTDIVPIQPLYLRPNIGRVRVPPANSFGVAFYAANGTLRLWSAGEAIEAGVCPP